MMIQDYDGGYLIKSDERSPTRALAALNLVLEVVGGGRSDHETQALVELAKEAMGPTELFFHASEEELESSGCGCEDIDWQCESASGESTGLWWHFSHPDLEVFE